jgi:hypothetical protein
MKINLHIERLVLDGLPIERRDGPTVQAAIEQELGRLLADTQFASSQTLAVARAPTINLATASPTGIGQNIATSIHRGLTT